MRTVPEIIASLRKKIAEERRSRYGMLVDRKELAALLDDYDRVSQELHLAIEDDRGVL